MVKLHNELETLKKKNKKKKKLKLRNGRKFERLLRKVAVVRLMEKQAVDHLTGRFGRRYATH